MKAATCFSALFLAAAQASAQSPSSLDLTRLWDFNNPIASEYRFREALSQALSQARGDEAFILQTQLARTYGLRREFHIARRILADLQPRLPTASAEAQARYQLEWGRTWASGTHEPAELTPHAKAQARAAYEAAWQLARTAGLDALAIDAVHMFAFVDREPATQLHWADAGLQMALRSTQPAAKRWEASMRHNRGYALHQLRRFAEALSEFEQALALRRQLGNPQGVHVARWMVAWTLRSLGRVDEALAIQHELEAAAEARGQPDGHVLEELEALYRMRADRGLAEKYAGKRAAFGR